jgi:hypothetical protein
MSSNKILPNVGGFLTSFITRRQTQDLSGPPLLLNPKRVPFGAFVFNIQTRQGSTYEIETSRDLKTWSILATDASQSDLIEFVDSDAPKSSYRFYRVRVGSFYSTNVIGFAVLTLPPGYSLISNPFKTPNNTVSSLFAGMPEWSAFCKFEMKLFKLSNNVVKDGVWSNPRETLSPGEGALICNPTDEFKTIHFVGDVLQGNLLNPVPSGFSIRSSLIPRSGRLDLDLGLPFSEGDVVHLFDRDKQSYVEHRFPSKSWDIDPPLVGVGEAFWVGKSSPVNWVQGLTPKVSAVK